MPLFLLDIHMKARRTTHYNGCLVFHPDGKPMFRCHESRAQWYLTRTLAKQIEMDGEEFCIQLTFTPKGHGQYGDNFFMARKEERCVCCGSQQELTRHHVVPYMYRKHLPDSAKGNNYHDILLICFDCHTRYERFADDLKQEISKTYNAPLPQELYARERGNVAASLAKSAARALVKHADRMPENVRNEKRRLVAEHLGCPVTDENITSLALSAQQWFEDSKDVHARKVVGSVDLQLFVETWRKHFISTMSPKFMPDFWDVKRGYDDAGSADKKGIV